MKEFLAVTRADCFGLFISFTSPFECTIRGGRCHRSILPPHWTKTKSIDRSITTPLDIHTLTIRLESPIIDAKMAVSLVVSTHEWIRRKRKWTGNDDRRQRLGVVVYAEFEGFAGWGIDVRANILSLLSIFCIFLAVVPVVYYCLLV